MTKFHNDFEAKDPLEAIAHTVRTFLTIERSFLVKMDKRIKKFEADFNNSLKEIRENEKKNKCI